MAISRGAGTEIIRTHLFEDLQTTEVILIYGVQHHIYTVLSMVVYCVARNASENGNIKLHGYDSYEGTTNEQINIAKVAIDAGETFVFNDKFSFNGTEPTNFTGPMDDATKQNAIADQASSNIQKLTYQTGGSSTTHDCVVTFIDQNNS